MNLSPEFIPAGFVAVNLILTGFAWLIPMFKGIRLNSLPWAFTFLIQGLIYALVFTSPDMPLEVKGFFSRLMIVLVCMSQYIPILASFVRSLKDNDR